MNKIEQKMVEKLFLENYRLRNEKSEFQKIVEDFDKVSQKLINQIDGINYDLRIKQKEFIKKIKEIKEK